MQAITTSNAMKAGIIFLAVLWLVGVSISYGQAIRPAPVNPASVGIHQDSGTDKIGLRVLYVGVADTERTQDFVGFLSRNFKEAKFANVRTFKEEHAQDSDVIILDKDGVEWGISRVDFPLTNIKFSETYSKPTISLGIPGAFFTGEMKLKTDYM